MKKLLCLVIASSLLLLSGCGINSDVCYNSTQKAYPSSTVEKISNNKYSFFVHNEDGSMYFVQTMSIFHTKPTKIILIPERKVK